VKSPGADTPLSVGEPRTGRARGGKAEQDHLALGEEVGVLASAGLGGGQPLQGRS